MSELERLIQELCPNGVEYKKVKEIVNVLRGKRLTKDQLKDDYTYPVFHGGLEPLGFYMNKNRDANTVMIINVGASAGTVGFCDKDFWSSDGCYCLSKSININSKFLYHAIAVQEHLLISKVRHAGIPTLDSKVIEELKIPVPPIEVQSEIVRILDNFTELKAELTAELTARKKQYEYYRTKLFDGVKECPKSCLIDCADIKRGVRVVKKDLLPDGEYPVYQNSLTSMGYYNDFNCEAGTTYVISAGAAGEIGYCYTDFWAADDCLVFKNLKGVLNRYIYHFLMTKSAYIKSNVRKASIPRLSRTVIEKLEIPIPSVEEQERIVDMLDRFDVLCSDISKGLPAEIEARQKQYEYYRDKLLTFKPAN